MTPRTPAEPIGRGDRAGIVSRGLAAVVDVATIVAVQLLIYAGATAIGFIWSSDGFNAPALQPFALFAASAGLTVVYLTVGWALAGRTYGASVLGIRVVDALGGAPGWARSGLRALCCLAFPVGILWVAVSAERRSVQDLLLRTNVVYDWHRN